MFIMRRIQVTRNISFILIVGMLLSIATAPYAYAIAPKACVARNEHSKPQFEFIQPKPTKVLRDSGVGIATTALSVLSGCADIIVEYPVITAISGIGVIIGIFFVTWRKFFPVYPTAGPGEYDDIQGYYGGSQE